MRSPQLRDPLWILQAKALDQHRCNSILLFTEPCAKKNTNHPTSCADAARCFMVFHGVFQLFGSFGPKIMSFPVEKIGLAPSPVPPNAWCLVADGQSGALLVCLGFASREQCQVGSSRDWQLIELMAGHFVYHDVGSLGELGDWKL